MSDDADVTLRAFEIKSSDINISPKDLITSLIDKLQSSKAASERRMLINSVDPNAESDILTNYKLDKNNQVFATMMRISPGDEVAHLDANLLSKPQITPEEISKVKITGATDIYKNHYYFLLVDNYLITNLGSTTSIRRVQIYLNWFVNSLFNITPCIDKSILLSLDNIRHISIGDISLSPSEPTGAKATGSESGFKIKIGKIAKELLKKVVKDAKSLNEIDLDNIVHAQLFLKFKSANKNNIGEVEKAFSAIIKPMEDIESLQIRTRDKKTIKTGKDLHLTKCVKIERIAGSFLNEVQLMQEMQKFLREIKEKYST